MVWSAAAIAVALLFALNIGAGAVATAMSSAYGGGAVRSRLIAVGAAACAALLGALFGGSAVAHTIGGGLVPARLLDGPLVLIVLVSASGTLLFANLAGIPLSTSEVTVGAVVGAGVAFRAIAGGKLLVVAAAWIVVPVAAFAIAWALARFAPLLDRRAARGSGRLRGILTLALICAGAYEAFAAGMNNVGNAVGPLIGAGLVRTAPAIGLGGAAMALGAALFGRRLLETTARKITRLSLSSGLIVSLSGGSLTVAASLLGLPVPLLQATTAAIVGIGFAREGSSALRTAIVRRILRTWAVSPFVSLVVSYSLVRLLILTDWYQVAIVAAIVVAMTGLLGFRRKRRAGAGEAEVTT